MNNNQLAEVAKFFGVFEDSIFAMDDEIKNSMTAVFEQVAVKNNVDQKALRERRGGHACKIAKWKVKYLEKAFTAEVNFYLDETEYLCYYRFTSKVNSKERRWLGYHVQEQQNQ